MAEKTISKQQVLAAMACAGGLLSAGWTPGALIRERAAEEAKA